MQKCGGVCYNRRMQIGVSTASLQEKYETENALSVLSEIGAETGEVYLKSFYEYRPEFAKKYSGIFKGVDCVKVSSLNYESQLFSRSRRVRGDGFYWLDQVMRSAQLFGAEYYNFQGITINDGLDLNIYEMADRLNEIIYFCSGCGVKVCVENAKFGAYGKPSMFGIFKSRCPQIFGTFNLFNAIKSGYPYGMYLKDMSGAIAQVIVTDIGENGQSCLPGCGLCDFKEIFKLLKDEGFDGNIFIDTINFTDISGLKHSVDFLKEIIYKLG